LDRDRERDAPLPDATSEPLLFFAIAGEAFAIRLGEVGGVVALESLREVPGAPPRVLGLAEWRGSLLAVLDLPALLGLEASEAAGCLIRLAPPLEQTALYLPGNVRLGEGSLEPVDGARQREGSERWFCDGGSLSLIDPARLLDEVHRSMWERSDP
jgi:purine-binding chemotaxis protein CheW